MPESEAEKTIAAQVTEIHRGLYGDPVNKVVGMIEKVNCIAEYKPELKFLRTVKNNLIKIVLALLTGVSASVISGFFIWNFIR